MPEKEVIRYLGHHLGLREDDGWEYVYRTNASGVVMMVAVTDAGELVLVEQYRKPVDCRVIELPAGLAGDAGDREEDLETAAQRELYEETGFTAGSFEKLLISPGSPGLSSELLNIYLARGLRRTGPGGGDASEDIVVHTVPLARAVAWLESRQAQGLLVDYRVYAGLFWAGLRA